MTPFTAPFADYRDLVLSQETLRFWPVSAQDCKPESGSMWTFKVEATFLAESGGGALISEILQALNEDPCHLFSVMPAEGGR